MILLVVVRLRMLWMINVEQDNERFCDCQFHSKPCSEGRDFAILALVTLRILKGRTPVSIGRQRSLREENRDSAFFNLQEQA